MFVKSTQAALVLCVYLPLQANGHIPSDCDNHVEGLSYYTGKLNTAMKAESALMDDIEEWQDGIAQLIEDNPGANIRFDLPERLYARALEVLQEVRGSQRAFRKRIITYLECVADF